MTQINNKLPYKDLTKQWLSNKNPNSHKVLDKNYFEHENVKYIVDDKKVVLDYSKKEKEIAEWLENTFGGEIFMLPRINDPEKIQTPDYLYKKEVWDLKTITGSGNQTIYHAIYKKKQQSNNYIFELTNSVLTIADAKKKIERLY